MTVLCQDIGDVSGGLAGASSSGGACGGVVVGDVPGSRLRPRVLGEWASPWGSVMVVLWASQVIRASWPARDLETR